MHMHAEETDSRWEARVGNPVTGQKMTATDEAAHREATFQAMKRTRIVKEMVSGDYAAVLRWKQAVPGQVIVGYSFDDPAKLDLALLRKEHAAGRLDAIGEVGVQYEGIAPNDPRMEPVYALAEELDIPLALHLHPGPPGAASSGSRSYGRRWAIRCCWRTSWSGIRGSGSTSCMRGGRSWRK